MRINKFVASASGCSRRAADVLIADGEVRVNGLAVTTGQDVSSADIVTLRGKRLQQRATTTIMLHKPAGYVVSRQGQGSATVYDLLPAELRHLKPVGRLDKDSSGLLLLTNDGNLAQQLTHPGYQKAKHYEIELDAVITPSQIRQIQAGVPVEEYISRLEIAGTGTSYTITMTQGKNRQIRKTFSALGRTVRRLHRTGFGPYQLGVLAPGSWRNVT